MELKGLHAKLQLAAYSQGGTESFDPVSTENTEAHEQELNIYHFEHIMSTKKQD